MTQQKWVYVVDHRSPRETHPNSFANFIYPNRVEEQKKGHLTAGTHGADFGELRALEASILDIQLGYGGVLHYRRAIHLSQTNLAEVEIYSTPEGHFVPIWSWLESPTFGWTDQTLLDLSAKGLTLLPKAINVRELGAANLYEQYLLWHDPQTFLELRKNWELAEDFFEFLKRETNLIPFNIMITTRQIREHLFGWLLNIINPLEAPLSQLSHDSSERRWPGYLAERLCTYYWHTHFSEIQPRFVETMRLDVASEVSTALYEDDYKAISNNLKKSFVLKSDSESALEFLSHKISGQSDELLILSKQLGEIQESLSWKATAPVRGIIARFVK